MTLLLIVGIAALALAVAGWVADRMPEPGDLP